LELSAGQSSFLFKVILRDAHGNKVLSVPSTETYTATLSGNNMDPLDLNVELVTGDNTGESKLFVTITDE